MKINKIIKFKSKLLNLKLLKTKTYKTSKLFNSTKIENIGFELKKALCIIYKYHISNKQILFIGTPLKLNKKLKYLLTNTKHIIIPQFLWKNGAINNLLSNNNIKMPKLISKLKKVPDLIVLLNKTPNNTILKESYKTKILTISLNYIPTIDKSTYKVPGDFKFIQKKIRNNFFYSLLVTTLKK